MRLLDKDYIDWKFNTFKTPLYFAFFCFFYVHLLISTLFALDGLTIPELIKFISTGIICIVITTLFFFRTKIKPLIQDTILTLLLVWATHMGMITTYLGTATQVEIIATFAVLIIGNGFACVYMCTLSTLCSGSTLLLSIPIAQLFSTKSTPMPVYTMLFPTIIATVIFNLSINEFMKRLYLTQNNLKEMAVHDGLTGCYNRKIMKGNIVKDGQLMFNGSIIMMDIDFFKKINDTYGHGIGDVVLCEFVEIIKSQIRKSDFLVRSGGEEFIIICKDSTAIAAKTLAERIRTIIHERTGEVKFTVSFGVSNFYEGERFEVVNNRADNLLYESKNTGRDKITCKVFK